MWLPCDRYELEEKILELDIEPGMRDGYQYPFVAEGKCLLYLIHIELAHIKILITRQEWDMGTGLVPLVEVIKSLVPFAWMWKGRSYM